MKPSKKEWQNWYAKFSSGYFSQKIAQRSGFLETHINAIIIVIAKHLRLQRSVYCIHALKKKMNAARLCQVTRFMDPTSA